VSQRFTAEPVSSRVPQLHIERNGHIVLEPPAATMSDPHWIRVTIARKKGAPSKREVQLATAIRDAADDVVRANDYAEGYMARAALVRAMQDLNSWAMAGRPVA
jgi:hypothetical protein